MGSRRHVLENLKARRCQHAGLWMDKYLEDQNREVAQNEKAARQKLVEDTAGISVPAPYHQFLKRWKQALHAKNLTPRYAVATNRLAVGRGDEAVTESSIALHHTYGTPVLPGSALKGLAAAYARKYLDDAEWRVENDQVGKAYRTLFGDTTQAGCVTFYDAYFDPDYSGAKPLQTDVITVHHQEYYQGKDTPPSDWDKPVPNFFLSASGTYVVALDGPFPDWVKAAYEILQLALEDLGIGAKTSSGYGRMALLDSPPAQSGGSAAPVTVDASPDPVQDYGTQKNALLAETPPHGRQRGTVTNVKDTFAFVQPAGGGKTVFVHKSDLQVQADPPFRPGQILEFRVGPGKKPGQVQGFEIVVLLQPGT